jgi:hypothetical protein
MKHGSVNPSTASVFKIEKSPPGLETDQPMQKTFKGLD